MLYRDVTFEFRRYSTAREFIGSREDRKNKIKNVYVNNSLGITNFKQRPLPNEEAFHHIESLTIDNVNSYLVENFEKWDLSRCFKLNSGLERCFRREELFEIFSYRLALASEEPRSDVRVPGV